MGGGELDVNRAGAQPQGQRRAGQQAGPAQDEPRAPSSLRSLSPPKPKGVRSQPRPSLPATGISRQKRILSDLLAPAFLGGSLRIHIREEALIKTPAREAAASQGDISPLGCGWDTWPARCSVSGGQRARVGGGGCGWGGQGEEHRAHHSDVGTEEG